MHNSQDVAITIKQLAKAKGILIGKLLSDCDLSKNTLASMQSGGYLPRTETIARMIVLVCCNLLLCMFIIIPICEFVNTFIHILGIWSIYGYRSHFKYIR